MRYGLKFCIGLSSIFKNLHLCKAKLEHLAVDGSNSHWKKQ
jgi:hypothetical protein